MIHRRDKFRAAPEAKHGSAPPRLAGSIWWCPISPRPRRRRRHAEGRDRGNARRRQRRIEADILLPFFGLSTSLGPIAAWSSGTAQPDRRRCDHGDRLAWLRHRRRRHLSRQLKLILTGFAEAAIAGARPTPCFIPRRRSTWEYSTTSACRRLEGCQAAASLRSAASRRA